MHNREVSEDDFAGQSYAEAAKKKDEAVHDKLLNRFASLRGAPADGLGGRGTPDTTLRPPSAAGSASPAKSKSDSTSPVKSKKRGGLSAPEDERPILSRHASSAKFSSKPVPVTKVHQEEGLERSIMFVDTPSPPVRGMGSHAKRRLPSAYDVHGDDGAPSSSTSTKEAEEKWHADNFEKEQRERSRQRSSSSASRPRSSSPALSRRGSTYSTQALPLSFNDLPCRAQHLILNQLMMQNSKDTAVLFTTLPSPAEGTSTDENKCLQYLGDLEVLGRGGVPMMMVHSNSMTVTMSL